MTDLLVTVGSYDLTTPKYLQHSPEIINVCSTMAIFHTYKPLQRFHKIHPISPHPIRRVSTGTKPVDIHLAKIQRAFNFFERLVLQAFGACTENAGPKHRKITQDQYQEILRY
uniref:Uncharacterized protein n=1 Tax=Micrurus spixii TaxID=129469 RepID=A0A2D4N4Q0_9SAUR